MFFSTFLFHVLTAVFFLVAHFNEFVVNI